MKTFFLNFLITLISCSFLSSAHSEDKKSNLTEVNFFTGVFDFSDENQKGRLFGFQHQNDDLFRDGFLGKISPITGGFLTDNNAAYVYSGAQAEYNLGRLSITPSFAPGYYHTAGNAKGGDAKDLGSALEFKTEVQMSLNLSDSMEFGMSYNHISNANLGEKNPGANSYMVNFVKKF